VNKTERTALISLVKQRFKLLRHDITVRKAEMLAELEARLDAQFAAHVKAWDDAQAVIDLARDEANRKANDVLRQVCQQIGQDYPVSSDHPIIYIRSIGNPIPARRAAARSQALAEIEAVEARARHELDTAENQLLTDLLTEALESAEAHQFLGLIPTVSTLMIPTGRLAALVGPIDNEDRP
jgi:hypothetical protein